MILIGDEHLSPKIIRAVCEVALRKGWRLDKVTGSDLCSREDEDWIEAFAGAGGNAILSADRAMLRRPTLMKKISDLKLIGIYLPSEWAEARRQYQAAHILYWWPKIEQTIETSAPGSAWIVPKGFNSGELRLYIDKQMPAPTKAAVK
ncbi:MAG: hypothetical protein E5Y03_25025 [Mesorhizobium sp.]|uniref:PIN-like domain-containing protein n=1 Tax=Mesorhizobium sp. TaxID=1871066 RepID=UPI00122454E4|nr:hypothetical protein [Mesorhizobium sp.]TIN98294.1 MAG: hypothetical protein E5Y03_25025 [Mesorhizobium sp.]